MLNPDNLKESNSEMEEGTDPGAQIEEGGASTPKKIKAVKQTLQVLKNASTTTKGIVIGGFFLLVLVLVYGFNAWHPHRNAAQQTTLYPVAPASKKQPASAITPEDQEHAQWDLLQTHLTQFQTRVDQQLQHLQTQLTQVTMAQQTFMQQQKSPENADQLKTMQFTLATLQTEVDTLTTQFQAIKTKVEFHNTLPVSKLPFHVLSLDIWDATPYVLVSFQGQNQLLKVGDTLSDWTVISVDYPTQIILFENTKNQTIRVIV